MIVTATCNKTSYAEAVRKIAAKDTVADDKVSQVPTAMKPTTSEIGTQTEVETGTQTIDTLDQTLKDVLMKEMAETSETSLSKFKQSIQDEVSRHFMRTNEELRKLRTIIRGDLEADLIERDKKIMDLLYAKIRMTQRATSRERPQTAPEPVPILTTEEIAAEITALHKPTTSMPTQDKATTERPSSQGSSRSSRKKEKVSEPDTRPPGWLPLPSSQHLLAKAAAEIAEAKANPTKEFAYVKELDAAKDDMRKCPAKFYPHYQLLHPDIYEGINYRTESEDRRLKRKR